ncbi:hypothetical protein J437_LFUL018578 [Ladona fulva]|uniref:Uncharacterized protein n=1 Tax=Ladona fulva TaxID=123851 RepID=A0A8K0KPR5_LADFU|nr:hypothetical protein J437_LFUL018578 [Ladona fulva]
MMKKEYIVSLIQARNIFHLLINNLPKEKYIHAKNVFKEKVDLITTRNGIFPYDCIDWKRFNENKLPEKEKFYFSTFERNNE